MRHQIRSAFTLFELLIVIGILGLLASLLLPAISAAREAARRMDCTSRMRQIGIAMSNYELTYGMLPALRLGSDSTGGPYARTSGLVMLLPFLEQSALHAKLQSSMLADQQTNFSSNPWACCPLPGVTGQSGIIHPWLDKVPLFRCPSDPVGDRAEAMGCSNYVFSVGDTIIDNASGPTRGMFESGTFRRLIDVMDGLSNTIAISEVRVNGKMLECMADVDLLIPSRYSERNLPVSTVALSSPPVEPEFFGRGRRWADGAPIYTAFNTVLPPGDVSANHRNDSDLTYGNFSAGSWHASGVNCLFGDSAVRFITSSIDCGDLSKRAPDVFKGVESPYGVWGKFGTRSTGEVADLSQLD